MKWTDLINGEIAGVYRATEGLFALAEGADLNWKPSTGKNWMTLGQLLHHCTNACGMCVKGFVSGDWGMPAGEKIEDLPPEAMLPPAEKMPSVESVAQARELLAADKATALGMVEQAGEERLETEQVDAPWAPGFKRPLGQQVLDMVGHLGNHKAQLFYYLKLMGKDVNTHHYYGMGQ